MQFNDDTDLPDPGAHVVLDDEDLGSATYDSDHDGIADSVIVGQEDYAVVITDSDHDGEADSVKAYDHDGNQVDPKTGAAVGDGSDSAGDDSSGASGSDTSGTEGQADSTDHTAGDGDADGSTTETSSSTEGQSGGESSGQQPAGDQGDGGDDAPADGGITVIGDDGTPVTVGQPTADLNGDGTPDTAVVQNHDGSTTGYTDVDGDGHADQITQINADGSVVIAVSDGDGHWQVESTGRLDSDGTYVEDPKSGAGEPAEPGVPGAEPSADGSSNIESAGAITFTSADGQAYPLGPPTADLSGDGRLDTVVNQLPDGTVVGYSDIDGDGQADQVTQIDPDGAVTIGVPDGAGGWEQAATGRIGDGGEFLPDSGAPVAS